MMTLTAVVASLTVFVSTPASAEGQDLCIPPAQASFQGDGSTYVCVIPGGSGPGNPPGNGGGGGGTPAPPTCPLDSYNGSTLADKPGRSANFCMGPSVCFTTDVYVPYDVPDGPKPNEDSKGKLLWCFSRIIGNAEFIRAFWSDNGEPTLLEQAQTAIGQIDLGAPTINISPTTRTLVNLDTWFWLAGAQREATGSSAFGLVAIATFQSLSVDPGDGRGPFRCDTLPTTAAEAEQDCFYAYGRASLRGTESVDGRPAYGITANTVYSLRFEVNGTPTPVPGAPATLTGPTSTAALRVDEAQTVVRPNR